VATLIPCALSRILRGQALADDVQREGDVHQGTEHVVCDPSGELIELGRALFGSVARLNEGGDVAAERDHRDRGGGDREQHGQTVQRERRAQRRTTHLECVDGEALALGRLERDQRLERPVRVARLSTFVDERSVVRGAIAGLDRRDGPIRLLDGR